MRPYERWHMLWQFFMVLDEEWPDEFLDEDSAIRAAVARATPAALDEALREWHAAFDGASDEEVSAVVGDLNPGYDPGEKFGGDREWAQWVREHLERELASREDAK
jgi:hypothetical protein